MSSKYSVSVVIPNWNGKEVILNCLTSVYNQSLIPNEVIVVDNGSVDGSVEEIKEKFPEAKLVELKKNIGFAGGVNVGIKTAKSNYVFLLNNDAVCDSECLKNIIRTVTKTKAQIVQALILNNNGKRIDSSGDIYSRWGLPFPKQRDENIDKAPKNDQVIFSACAGACLYNKTIFKKIGYFDEMFFAYYEDVDLSMRAQLQGLKIWLAAQARVFHSTNHTSNKIPGFGREMAIRNSIYLFWKNLPLSIIFKIFPKFVYSNLRLSLAAIKNGYILQVIRAYISALLHSALIIKKRQIIQQKRLVSSKQFLAKLPNVNPF